MKSTCLSGLSHPPAGLLFLMTVPLTNLKAGINSEGSRREVEFGPVFLPGCALAGDFRLPEIIAETHTLITVSFRHCNFSPVLRGPSWKHNPLFCFSCHIPQGFKILSQIARHNHHLAKAGSWQLRNISGLCVSTIWEVFPTDAL